MHPQRAHHVLAITLLAVCPLAACKAPPLPTDDIPAASSSFALEDHANWTSLGVGDRLQVQLLGHPELSTLPTGTAVDAEGCIMLPLVGAVEVAGLAPAAAGERLEVEFARFLKRPAVTVSVVEAGARLIWVLGEVESSGPKLLDRPTNALEALTLGGGFGAGADREFVCVLRRTGEYIDVHLFNAATPGRDGLVAIRPGDILFVRQSGAGRFRDQVMPIIQGVQPAISSLISLGLVASAINK